MHDEWSKIEILQSVGISLSHLKDNEKEILKSLDYPVRMPADKMPRLAYISHKDWEVHDKEKDKSLPVRMIKDECIVSSSPVLNKFALKDQGLNANTAILCLAAMGIDLVLPNICFEEASKDEVQSIKEKLKEERIAYLSAITSMANESYQRLTSGELDDVMSWARNEVAFQLYPKARHIENSLLKLEKKSLKQAGVSFLKDGIPAIGSGFVNNGWREATKVTIEQTLKLITYALGQKIENRIIPEISYIVKISESLNK